MQLDDLIRDWLVVAYPHQKQMFAGRYELKRNYVVDRQRGTTYAMAIEGNIMQRETGRLQVFCMATQQQAAISQHYIVSSFAREDIDLRRLLFVSPAMLCKFPHEPWDLYVGDYAFLWRKDVDLIQGAISAGNPHRVTWTTAVPDDPVLKLLFGAEKISLT